MKGVVLAGGSGSRLFPLTLVTNKHLLPVFDRPMIYHPLATLRRIGCREVMVVVGGRSVGDILELLHDGSDVGLHLTYRYQRGAFGIAHAIGLAKAFADDDPIAVVLGDNVLQDEGCLHDFAAAFVAGESEAGAVLTEVVDPTRFSVAEIGPDGVIVGFEEKPREPKSHLIPVGVYFFRPSVFEVIEGLRPSGRGELEITDLLNHYLQRKSLVHTVYRGQWQDAGTIESLLQANALAASFAADQPLDTRHDVAEVRPPVGESVRPLS
ncbi:MAG: NTP transferase domain-containing protein [Chloroflexi bacterium]|nr:NTP transferase domain-containing protein [Chloroflexota bacterium]